MASILIRIPGAIPTCNVLRSCWCLGVCISKISDTYFVKSKFNLCAILLTRWTTTPRICIDCLSTRKVALLVIVQAYSSGTITSASPWIEDAPATISPTICTALRRISWRGLWRLTGRSHRRVHGGLRWRLGRWLTWRSIIQCWCRRCGWLKINDRKTVRSIVAMLQTLTNKKVINHAYLQRGLRGRLTGRLWWRKRRWLIRGLRRRLFRGMLRRFTCSI